MKILRPLFFLLISASSFPQSPQLENVMGEFQKHYNDSNYEAIHYLFDPVMKTFLTKEQMVDLFTEVKSNFGAIQTMEFSHQENSAYIYRTQFDKAVSDIFIGLNKENQISAWFIPRNTFENSSVLKRNATKMLFPFKEEAFVYWGGESVETNYHMADLNQQYAYDILMVANGAPYKGDPTKNESYFVFGKDLIAPCDAKVVKVIEGVKDNSPGEVNTDHPTGNTIVLETQRKEHLLFAHLKQNSVKVKEGDLVKQGETIAQCGNSGNTTQAHLHLQLQNTADLYNTIGAKLYFDEVLVNGEIKRDYIPQKEDFVKNSSELKD
ncbi:peptidoglycan DD-metalloendopeptidase family protein [Flavobacteriaceae bacterium M23B6Z8]